ncbi:hypothetical protein IscW_ISCW012122 [Ixodes scapularis]|uniref:Uncharacterized protein n=1 Tax=Ixodes scapularis TaxID=6945 RepID=B7QGD3_IXOSC|nr:hypothetical protein IscW_ISCW012122 [Ixodes scapularis]|eukprot:XP_002401504.1 hypothetical protein IscW_ISCW012122 [Ixodes scapularis]
MMNLMILQKLVTHSSSPTSPPHFTPDHMTSPLANQRRAPPVSSSARQPISVEPRGHAFIQASFSGFTKCRTLTPQKNKKTFHIKKKKKKKVIATMLRRAINM